MYRNINAGKSENNRNCNCKASIVEFFAGIVTFGFVRSIHKTDDVPLFFKEERRTSEVEKLLSESRPRRRASASSISQFNQTGNETVESTGQPFSTSVTNPLRCGQTFTSPAESRRSSTSNSDDKSPIRERRTSVTNPVQYGEISPAKSRRCSTSNPAEKSPIPARRRASTSLEHLLRPSLPRHNSESADDILSGELDYHDLKQLQRLRRQLSDGIFVTRLKNDSETRRIILGCTAKFKALTLRTPIMKRRASISSGETQVRKMCTVIEIRAGNDPDPSCQGFTGTSVLRKMSGCLDHSMSIIWSSHSLHLEFDSEIECSEFITAIRLWWKLLR